MRLAVLEAPGMLSPRSAAAAAAIAALTPGGERLCPALRPGIKSHFSQKWKMRLRRAKKRGEKQVRDGPPKVQSTQAVCDIKKRQREMRC